MEINEDLIPQYSTKMPKMLPAGDASNPVYWCSLQNGTYYYAHNVNYVDNMPATFGYVKKDGYYSEDGSKSDFNVTFYKQATGSIWRTSGNHNTTTCIWNEVAYTSAITNIVQFAPISAFGAEDDFNNYTRNGIWYFTNTPVNAPCYNGWLLVLSWGSTVKQVVLRLGSAGNHYNTFIRTLTSGAWQDWKLLQIA